MLHIWQNFKFVIHVFRILGVLKQPLGGALIIIRIRIAGLKSAKGLEQQGFNIHFCQVIVEKVIESSL